MVLEVTCIAWFVTLPELFAIGDAVALTPPTVSAMVGKEFIPSTAAITVGIYLLYRLRLL